MTTPSEDDATAVPLPPPITGVPSLPLNSSSNGESAKVVHSVSPRHKINAREEMGLPDDPEMHWDLQVSPRGLKTEGNMNSFDISKYRGLSVEQVIRAKELFAKYDVDLDGNIEKEDFRHIVKDVLPKRSALVINRITELYFTQADLNHNGSIDEEEFLLVFEYLLKERPLEERKKEEEEMRKKKDPEEEERKKREAEEALRLLELQRRQEEERKKLEEEKKRAEEEDRKKREEERRLLEEERKRLEEESRRLDEEERKRQEEERRKLEEERKKLEEEKKRREKEERLRNEEEERKKREEEERRKLEEEKKRLEEEERRKLEEEKRRLEEEEAERKKKEKEEKKRRKEEERRRKQEEEEKELIEAERKKREEEEERKRQEEKERERLLRELVPLETGKTALRVVVVAVSNVPVDAKELTVEVEVGNIRHKGSHFETKGKNRVVINETFIFHSDQTNIEGEVLIQVNSKGRKNKLVGEYSVRGSDYKVEPLQVRDPTTEEVALENSNNEKPSLALSIQKTSTTGVFLGSIPNPPPDELPLAVLIGEESPDFSDDEDSEDEGGKDEQDESGAEDSNANNNESEEVRKLKKAANSKKLDLDLIATLLKEEEEHINQLAKWKNKKKASFLHLMCLKGDSKMVEWLVSKKARVDTTDLKGMTPLHLAAATGSSSCCRILLENGVSIDAKDKFGCTPLHYACLNGHKKIANLLLEKEADIEAKDKNKATPIFKAAFGGHQAVAQTLATRGALVDVEDKNGNTPALIAAMRGHTELAAWALDEGKANMRALNKWGDNLLWAFLKNFNEELFKKVQTKMDINLKMGPYEFSLLHRALQFLPNPLCEKACELLLQQGINHELRTAEGRTPLFYAAYYGKTKIVDRLLKLKSDPRTADKNKNTPLHYASNRYIAELLCRKGADPNAKNNQGNTPLHTACVFHGNEVAGVIRGHEGENSHRNKWKNRALTASWCGVRDITLPFYDKDVHYHDCGGILITHVMMNV